MLHTTLTGNLGQDATVRTLPGGDTVIGFSIANNEKWTDKDGNKQERVTWVNCNWFTNRTNVVPYLLKGTLVGITGKPSVEVYKDKNNETQAILKLRVDTLELLSSKKEENSPARTTTTATTAHQTADAPNYAGIAAGAVDDDLPF